MNSRGSSSHQPLPSLSEPASPATEEDLAKASAWDDEDTSTLVPSKWKGKGRQRDDDDDDRTVEGESPHREAGEYPPMAEDDLEARKIEQNLKRWETLEKQRRKKARESRGNSDSPSSSFSVSDVGRRASQLWGKADVARPRARTSGHKILADADEAHQMGETGPPSASSPVDTPRTSTADTPRTSMSGTDNPFEDPARQPDALMKAAGPGSLPSTPKAVAEKRRGPERPILQVQHASFVKHPPPKPLDLPAPKSQAERAQEMELEEEEESRKPRRWWTEWLCGCREEGDHQAGRTNPME